jgi:hypothetical protein
MHTYGRSSRRQYDMRIHVYYHDYYKNNSPKNPYKGTGYDTQFLHPHLLQI